MGWPRGLAFCLCTHTWVPAHVGTCLLFCYFVHATAYATRGSPCRLRSVHLHRWKTGDAPLATNTQGRPCPCMRLRPSCHGNHGTRRYPFPKLSLTHPLHLTPCPSLHPPRAIAADGTALRGRSIKVTYATPPGGAAAAPAATAAAPAAAVPAAAAPAAAREPSPTPAAAPAPAPTPAARASQAPAAAAATSGKGAAVEAAAPGGRVPGYNVVYVGNVDFEATAEDLTQLFTKAGARPSQVRMHTDRKGR